MEIVEKYVFKGKESNCYVIILFGDPLHERMIRVENGHQNI